MNERERETETEREREREGEINEYIKTKTTECNGTNERANASEKKRTSKRAYGVSLREMPSILHKNVS